MYLKILQRSWKFLGICQESLECIFRVEIDLCAMLSAPDCSRLVLLPHCLLVFGKTRQALFFKVCKINAMFGENTLILGQVAPQPI